MFGVHHNLTCYHFFGSFYFFCCQIVGLTLSAACCSSGPLLNWMESLLHWMERSLSVQSFFALSVLGVLARPESSFMFSYVDNLPPCGHWSHMPGIAHLPYNNSVECGRASGNSYTLEKVGSSEEEMVEMVGWSSGLLELWVGLCPSFGMAASWPSSSSDCDSSSPVIVPLPEL